MCHKRKSYNNWITTTGTKKKKSNTDIQKQCIQSQTSALTGPILLIAINAMKEIQFNGNQMK